MAESNDRPKPDHGERVFVPQRPPVAPQATPAPPQEQPVSTPAPAKPPPADKSVSGSQDANPECLVAPADAARGTFLIRCAKESMVPQRPPALNATETNAEGKATPQSRSASQETRVTNTPESSVKGDGEKPTTK